MRLVITTEARFVRTPDGTVWTHAGLSHQFWTRYLAVFDRVRVVARLVEARITGDGAMRVDGPGVEVWPVPYYLGPLQYLRRWPAVRGAVQAAAGDDDAVILRIPSPIGGLLAAARIRSRRPFAVELVGDPYDMLGRGVIHHPLRPLLRNRSVAATRSQCRRAVAVASVTERSLQARYPAHADAMTTSISSVDLPPEAYVPRPRTADRGRTVRTLVSVGSLEQMYKGIDTLIGSLAQLVAAGIDLRLVHVGDGRFRPRVEQLAGRLHVADRVTFTGTLPTGEPVRRHLDAADIFVMPSRTEGVPRALIEAMARGLPAIGSNVGGIPELLPAEYLVPPDDVPALADGISRLLDDPTRMAAASAANLAKAQSFTAELLRERRGTYYRAVRDATRAVSPRPYTHSRGRN